MPQQLLAAGAWVVLACAASLALAQPEVHVVTAPDAAADDRFGASVDVSGSTVVVGAARHDDGASDSGAVYVGVLARGFVVPQAELRAGDSSAGAHFGAAVAIDRDTVAVGAPDAGDAGAVYVFERTRGVWTQTAKLVAADAAAGDRFGASVALEGDSLAVGAPGDDASTGAVYVFVRAGVSWSQEAKLRPTAASAGSSVGGAVALSATTLVAGAAGYAGTGGAFVFVRDGSVWTPQATLAAADASAADAFGRAVSIDADRIAVGAPGDDDTAADSGSSYVFERTGTVWTQRTKLVSPTPGAGDGFGSTVGLAGDRIVAGSALDDDDAADAGSAFQFVHDALGWHVLARLAATGAAAGDQFGAAVAVDAGIVVVGSPLRDGPVADAGRVHVLRVETPVTASDAADGDGFGTSLALDGDTAVVGAPFDALPPDGAGSTYVFVRTDGVWTQQAKLVVAGAAADDQFGCAVAISGDVVLVGARGADSPGAANAGAAYVFVRSAGAWTQQAKLVAPDPAADDAFGASVAVAGDTAVVGVPLDDAAAGGDVGSARVFTRSGAAWTQTTSLAAPDAVPGARFGAAVAFDGATAVVGAPYDDSPGAGAGAAHVFERASGLWTHAAKLVAADVAPGDRFGAAVAVRGVNVLVGAPLADLATPARADAGAAYFFASNSGAWIQRTKAVASDAAAGDGFGTAVALDDRTALIGSGAAAGGAPNTGAAYLFRLASVTWKQAARLAPPGPAANARFGGAVAIDGETALVAQAGTTPSGAAVLAGALWDVPLPPIVWDEEVRIVPADTSQFAHFGAGVALDGDTMIVGARYTLKGAAYVYVRSGGAWTLQQELAGSDVPDGGGFGLSVALQGDVAVVGAPWGQGAHWPGAAYVFERSDGVWTERSKLVASDPGDFDEFGWSVALDGDTIVVGAPFNDDVGLSTGSAYVFTRTAGVWSQADKWISPTPNVFQNWGYAVALDGDTALVGRTGVNNETYVFVRSGSTWSLQAKLSVAVPATKGQLGFSLALEGDTALLGELGDPGAAHLFTRSGGTWTEGAKLVESVPVDTSYFGIAVALHGGAAVVGAPREPSSQTLTQDAYVFARSGATWRETAKLGAAEPTTAGHFGISVALDGETIVVGSDLADTVAGRAAGAANVFARRGDDFTVVRAALPVQTTAGKPTSVALAATGGTRPYQWRVASGTLPAGLVLDSRTARIAGAPNAAGSFDFAIEGNDALGDAQVEPYSVIVNAAPRITTGALPVATAGKPYAFALGATGGTGLFLWRLDDAGGSGLSLVPATGLLSGGPLAIGTYAVTVGGADAVGIAAPTVTLTLRVRDRAELVRGRSGWSVAAGEAVAERSLDLLAGTSLTVTAKSLRGASAPTIEILSDAGLPLDLGGTFRTAGRLARIRAFVVPATGRWLLRVTRSADDPSSLPVAVAVTAKAQSRRKFAFALADGATSSFSVAALAGAKVTVTVTAARGERVDPHFVSATDAAGATLAAAPTEKPGRSRVRLQPVVGGDLRVDLGTRNATSGRVDVKVTIASPRGYEFALPDPAAGAK